MLNQLYMFVWSMRAKYLEPPVRREFRADEGRKQQLPAGRRPFQRRRLEGRLPVLQILRLRRCRRLSAEEGRRGGHLHPGEVVLPSRVGQEISINKSGRQRAFSSRTVHRIRSFINQNNQLFCRRWAYNNYGNRLLVVESIFVS